MGWKQRVKEALKEPVVSNRKHFVILTLGLFIPQIIWYFLTLGAYFVDPTFVLVYEGGFLSKWFLLTNQFHLYWLVSFPIKLATSVLFVFLYYYMRKYFPIHSKFMSNFYYLLIFFLFVHITINDIIGWGGRILQG